MRHICGLRDRRAAMTTMKGHKLHCANDANADSGVRRQGGLVTQQAHRWGCRGPSAGAWRGVPRAACGLSHCWQYHPHPAPR